MTETIICAACRRPFVRQVSQTWRILCVPCWKAGRQPEPLPAIPADKLKALIRLAHPDLHGGSQLATETTQWLLSLRDKRTGT